MVRSRAQRGVSNHRARAAILRDGASRLLRMRDSFVAKVSAWLAPSRPWARHPGVTGCPHLGRHPPLVVWNVPSGDLPRRPGTRARAAGAFLSMRALLSVALDGLDHPIECGLTPFVHRKVNHIADDPDIADDISHRWHNPIEARAERVSCRSRLW